VNEADIQAALGRLSDASGTRMGQSAKRGRVASFARKQNRKIS
jgi:hypothetical protein